VPVQTFSSRAHRRQQTKWGWIFSGRLVSGWVERISARVRRFPCFVWWISTRLERVRGWCREGISFLSPNQSRLYGWRLIDYTKLRRVVCHYSDRQHFGQCIVLHGSEPLFSQL